MLITPRLQSGDLQLGNSRSGNSQMFNVFATATVTEVQLRLSAYSLAKDLERFRSKVNTISVRTKSHADLIEFARLEPNSQ